MQLQFTKMNGAGNDFVMLDNRDGAISLTQDQIARLCDRHRGIGADGMLLVEPATSDAHFRMRYYNADGGEAEMCGNGARCFARFAGALMDTQSRALSFETLAGQITARLLENGVELQMSQPHSLTPVVDLPVGSALVPVHFINTGVPHAVVFVHDLELTAVHELGAGIRYHEHFSPKGTNVNFVQVLDPETISIRTYERGVEGETLACGTGVVASALIHHQVNEASSPIRIKVRGGDTLQVSFRVPSPGSFDDVTLTGPADFVFDGRVEV